MALASSTLLYKVRRESATRLIANAAVPTWLRRIRAALTMGFTWALVWAPVGVLVGLAVDPDGRLDEPWPLIFAYPGFIGGVLFSIILAHRARRRTVAELSLPRVTIWGGLAGLAVGTVPFLIGTPTGRLPLTLLYAVVAGAATALSAASAAATVAVAQRGRSPALPPGHSLDDRLEADQNPLLGIE